VEFGCLQDTPPVGLQGFRAGVEVREGAEEFEEAEGKGSKEAVSISPGLSIFGKVW